MASKTQHTQSLLAHFATVVIAGHQHAEQRHWTFDGVAGGRVRTSPDLYSYKHVAQQRSLSSDTFPVKMSNICFHSVSHLGQDGWCTLLTDCARQTERI